MGVQVVVAWEVKRTFLSPLGLPEGNPRGERGQWVGFSPYHHLKVVVNVGKCRGAVVHQLKQVVSGEELMIPCFRYEAELRNEGVGGG